MDHYVLSDCAFSPGPELYPSHGLGKLFGVRIIITGACGKAPCLPSLRTRALSPVQGTLEIKHLRRYSL